MTNGRENRKPWQPKRQQRRRPRRRRNTSSSSSLTGGRASVPFFFALCCRSVTPVVFTSPLSLGNAVQWRFAAHPRKNRALVARKSLGRGGPSGPLDRGVKPPHYPSVGLAQGWYCCRGETSAFRCRRRITRGT